MVNDRNINGDSNGNKKKPNKGQFVKGDPRCYTGGRGKGKTGFATLLKEMGKEEHEGGKSKMLAVCEKLYKLALAGEPWAIQALMDRTDGKPRQVMEMLDNHRNIGGMSDPALTELFLQNSQEN